MLPQDQWDQGAQREATAYHEAGHAVMDVHVSLPLESVDIKRRNGDLGGCRCAGPPMTVQLEVESLLDDLANGRTVDHVNTTAAAREWIEKMIQSSLAGGVAEVLFHGRSLEHGELIGVHSDHMTVRSLAGIRWPTTEQRERVLEMQNEIGRLFGESAMWSAITAVARALLKSEQLSGDEVRDLYRDATQR